MADTSSGWNGLVEGNAAIRFLDINLRGIGQVIFQNNPLTGLLFLAAIFWGAYVGGQLVIGVSAAVATVIATVTAMLLRVDEASLRQGLFGFNGVLVGAAVPTFINAPTMWVLVVVGAAVSTVVMLAVSNVMKTWGAPALTFPFVLTTWFLVLAAYPFGAFTISGMGPPALTRSSAAAAVDLVTVESQAATLFEAWLKGPAQVFLINNWISGILVVVGLAVSSFWAAGLALVGSAIGVAMAPVGIPTFTAPFVFVTWLFLLPKADLKPHPYAPIENGVVGHSDPK